MKISPDRILYLDEVRSLAIILVVLGHVVRHYSVDFNSWLIGSGIFSLTRIGVPLFFTVSGALLLSRKHNLDNFLEKRIKRVFVPLVFWGIVYIIAGVVFWQFELTIEYCFNIVFAINDLSYHFWFIWSLLGVYLLIPIISSFIREYGFYGYKYLIYFTVILSVLSTLGFFSLDRIGHIFRVVYYFFSVLGYFVWGSYIQNCKLFSWSRNKSFLFGLLLFAIGIIGHFIQIYYGGLGGTQLKPVDFFNIFVVMETVGLFIVFKYADVRMISSKLKPIKERRLGHIIVAFSSCSFGIYLSHYIIVGYLFKFGFMKLWPSYGFNYFLLSSLIIVCICWLLIWVMSKIPILKIGSGVK